MAYPDNPEVASSYSFQIYDTIWHNMTQHDMTWHDTTWHNMKWHNMKWHNMTQHDTTKLIQTWLNLTLTFKLFQMTNMVQGIYDQYQLSNQEYFIGISVYPNATGISNRNWETLKIMDS